eukprot:scaffold3570_cov227-Amphora_coffeaeformis.AAC.13
MPSMNAYEYTQSYGSIMKNFIIDIARFDKNITYLQDEVVVSMLRMSRQITLHLVTTRIGSRIKPTINHSLDVIILVVSNKV